MVAGQLSSTRLAATEFAVGIAGVAGGSVSTVVPVQVSLPASLKVLRDSGTNRQS